MVVLKLKYSKIQRMKKKGASHLPAPPVGRSCLDDGPIPTAPPKTSMVTNQYNCIYSYFLIIFITTLISRVHMFIFKCSIFYTIIS